MIGTLLGNRYELLEKIGEGGMAIVYKAKCHLLNRFVAVKVLKQEHTNDQDFVEKFKREAMAAASLSDHNIVSIYDVGSDHNVNYIIMEYVKGKTLKQIIQEQKRLNYKKAIDIASQICKALECAHKNYIIHRDVKPHNILVTEEGVAKVTDFGIAKATNSATITNTSKVMGSAHYFSPEQAKGSFVDVRSDIYSLGIVLYEMVTGRVPYDAESPVSVALKHIQEPVLPPNQINEYIPESLNKLILKAIEKEPIKRYQTTKEMHQDLQKIQNNVECDIVMNNYDDQYTRVMDPVVVKENKKENYKENYEEEEMNRMNGKSKKIIMVSVAILIVIVVGGLLGFVYANWQPHEKTGISSKETAIPKIVGLTKEDAKKMLEDKGLKLTIASKVKSDSPEGTITATYPQEGTVVKLNSDVRVYISGGPTNTIVPGLRDMDIKTAKDTISNAGLQLGNIDYVFDETISKDSVVRQTPEPDSVADKNTKVSLVVSKGPEIRLSTVPDLKGSTIDEAAKSLASAGLKLGIKTEVETNDKTLDGRIFNQSVDSKSQVKEGNVVNVSYYVYKEPEKKKVTVPNFKGITVGEAKAKGAALGLKVVVVGKDTDFVEDQSVKQDTQVEEGSTVNLKITQAAVQPNPPQNPTGAQ